MLYNVSLTKHVIDSYLKGETIDVLVATLKEETKNPTRKNNKINFASFDWDKPNANPWNQLGLRLIDDNKLAEAEYLYNELCAMVLEVNKTGDDHSQIGFPWNNLGIVYENMGQIEKAIENFEKAFRLDVIVGNQESLGKENLYRTLLANAYQHGQREALGSLAKLPWYKKLQPSTWVALMYLALSGGVFLFYKIANVLNFEELILLLVIIFIFTKFERITDISALGAKISASQPRVEGETTIPDKN